jgi:phage/plasmid primase-like uncharacterized protein
MTTVTKPRIDLTQKWGEILPALAPELSEAIESANRSNPHVPCPVHGGKDGFRLYKDFESTGGGVCNTCGQFPNGVLLLAWLKNITTKEAYRLAAAYVEGRDESAVPIRHVPKPKPVDPKEYARNRARIVEAWKGSVPFAGSLAETYVKARGVWSKDIDGRALRLHPSLRYWTEQKTDAGEKKLISLGDFPVMLAAVTDLSGAVLSLHRTFLSVDGKGKAPVPDAKKLMKPAVPTISGGAIQLMRAHSNTLGVAEGIETALAAHAGSGYPAWACVSAAMLGAFEPPTHIRRLLIWADKDAKGAGMTAALKLRDRLASRDIQVVILLPDMPIPEGSKGVDWCDVWTAVGSSGFPAIEPFREAA